MRNEEQIRREVREIVTRVVPDLVSEIQDDTDIFSVGVDSVSATLLISELENHYSIALEGDDIPYEQFTTIAGIASHLAAVPAVRSSDTDVSA